MTSYAALLRGINVGGKNKVPMADLRVLLAGLGHGQVSTHLNSGNGLFTSDRADTDAMAREIEAAIESGLGLKIATLVRSREELLGVLDSNPLATQAAAEPARFVVYFLSGQADPARLAAIDPSVYAPDQCVLSDGGRELYAYCPGSLNESKLTRQFVEKRLDQEIATARNWNTVVKLLSLLS
jgi:uncharacterized protein (DUF1697 family)